MGVGEAGANQCGIFSVIVFCFPLLCFLWGRLQGWRADMEGLQNEQDWGIYRVITKGLIKIKLRQIFPW